MRNEQPPALGELSHEELDSARDEHRVSSGIMAPFAIDDISRVMSLRDGWIDFLCDVCPTHVMTLTYRLASNFVAKPFESTAPDEDGEFRATPRELRARLAAQRPRQVPKQQVEMDLDQLHIRIDREIIHKKAERLSPDRRSDFRGIIEHPESNCHVHLFWRTPGSCRTPLSYLIVAYHWSEIVASGTVHLDEVRDPRQWAAYMTKDYCHLGDGISDRLVLPRAAQ
jgi:hypothetical protein